LAGHDWQLEDRLSEQAFVRDGAELAGEGLYVALEPWASHFLAFAPHPVGVMPTSTGAASLSA
jgi:hypothetical protein